MRTFYVLIPFWFLILSSCRNSYDAADEQYHWEEALVTAGVDSVPFDLFLRVFKLEDVIEVWVKPQTIEQYTHLKDYPVCRKSGTLGPKRKEGDRQVPEGFYHIDRFNPNSSFHLSLGINYPNASDKIRGDQKAPGSDIFIHGACVTVGCLPITNPLIEELYALAEMAKGHEGQIPVHIFPFRMNGPLAKTDQRHQSFWAELLPAYRFFEQKKELPIIEIDEQGKYLILQ